MLPVSAGEVLYNQTDSNRLLAGTAVIMRSVWAADGYGGSAETFSAAGTVSARLGPGGGMEQTAGGGIIPISDLKLTVPAGTDIRSADQIVFAGTTYEVVSLNSWSSYEQIRRVDLKKIG